MRKPVAMWQLRDGGLTLSRRDRQYRERQHRVTDASFQQLSRLSDTWVEVDSSGKVIVYGTVYQK